MMAYQTTELGAGPMQWATPLVIAVTCIFSLIGFSNQRFEEKYIFCPRHILAKQEYWRLLTSAFLHAGWPHLIFNMMSLYSFGTLIELVFGPIQFLMIYFAAILGGNLLSLWLHRHHEYLAYGASGGVCGIIFAHIVLFPGGNVSALFLPIGIPTWAYGIGFLAFSFFALKKDVGNIGHDAHIGGAVIGLLTATVLHPSVMQEQPKLLVTLLVISAALFVYFFKNPLFLSLASFDGGRNKQSKVSPGTRAANLEVDRILEKISKHGLHSLKEEERQLLHAMSNKYQRRAESSGRESDLVI